MYGCYYRATLHLCNNAFWVWQPNACYNYNLKCLGWGTPSKAIHIHVLWKCDNWLYPWWTLKWYMSHVKRKNAFKRAQNAQILIILHLGKYQPGFCSLFILSVVFNDSVNKQWKSWSVCAGAQADLGFYFSYKPEDTFLHGAAHMKVWHNWH